MNAFLRRLAVCTILSATLGVAGAMPGNLDRSFGLGGKVILAPPFVRLQGRQHMEGRAVLVLPDGKIVVGGDGDYGGDTGLLVRYLADGTLDGTFGNNGRVVPGYARVQDLVLQPDGKLLVASGGNGYAESTRLNTLARHHPDGTLDTSFGTDGLVRLETIVGWGSLPYSPRSVALQPDGKIVLALGPILTRLNPDGSNDSGFGAGGVVSMPVSGSLGALAVALQADGKIVAVGSNGDDFTLTRHHGDGTLDATLGGSGLVTTSIGSARDMAIDVAVQPDGKILAIGTASDRFQLSAVRDLRFALARYDSDGILDPSFGSGGVVETSLHAHFSGESEARAAAVQPDGKIVVAGQVDDYTGSTRTFKFALVRYAADGSLDPGFGSGGAVVVSLRRSLRQVAEVALQPDGRIVGVSSTNEDPGRNLVVTLVVARFEGGTTPACGADSDGDGVCDAIDNCPVLANPTQSNGDADASGDACDACNNWLPNERLSNEPERLTLGFEKLGPPEGDERLTFRGTFGHVESHTDPIVDGVRFLVSDSSGAIPVDVTIPGGTYDPVTRVGWSIGSSGAAWTYRNASGSAPGGITKVQLRRLSSYRLNSGSEFVKVRVVLKGRNANYPINPANLPLAATLVLDTPLAVTGACREALFWGPSNPVTPRCTSSDGQLVKCGY